MLIPAAELRGIQKNNDQGAKAVANLAENSIFMDLNCNIMPYNYQ